MTGEEPEKLRRRLTTVVFRTLPVCVAVTVTAHDVLPQSACNVTKSQWGEITISLTM